MIIFITTQISNTIVVDAPIDIRIVYTTVLIVQNIIQDEF